MHYLCRFYCLWIRNWGGLIAILCFLNYQYQGVCLGFFNCLYLIDLSLMFWCITSINLLRIWITCVISMWWLRVVSLSNVIIWISVLWIIAWSILIVVITWSLIVWSVVRIITWSIVLISLISIIWKISTSIAGTVSIFLYEELLDRSFE